MEDLARALAEAQAAARALQHERLRLHHALASCTCGAADALNPFERGDRQAFPPFGTPVTRAARTPGTAERERGIGLDWSIDTLSAMQAQPELGVGGGLGPALGAARRPELETPPGAGPGPGPGSAGSAGSAGGVPASPAWAGRGPGSAGAVPASPAWAGGGAGAGAGAGSTTPVPASPADWGAAAGAGAGSKTPVPASPADWGAAAGAGAGSKTPVPASPADWGAAAASPGLSPITPFVRRQAAATGLSTILSEEGSSDSDSDGVVGSRSASRSRSRSRSSEASVRPMPDLSAISPDQTADESLRPLSDPGAADESLRPMPDLSAVSPDQTADESLRPMPDLSDRSGAADESLRPMPDLSAVSPDQTADEGLRPMPDLSDRSGAADESLRPMPDLSGVSARPPDLSRVSPHERSALSGADLSGAGYRSPGSYAAPDRASLFRDAASMGVSSDARWEVVTVLSRLFRSGSPPAAAATSPVALPPRAPWSAPRMTEAERARGALPRHVYRASASASA